MKKEQNFNSIVEAVKLMDKEEKEELKNLLEKYLIEEKRKEILKEYKESLSELKEKKLNFSSNISKLKEELLKE